MKDILKSTTNTIVMFIVIATFAMVMYIIVMGIQEINTFATSIWTGVVGWAIGIKSGKKKHQEPEVKVDDIEAIMSEEGL